MSSFLQELMKRTEVLQSLPPDAQEAVRQKDSKGCYVCFDSQHPVVQCGLFIVQTFFFFSLSLFVLVYHDAAFQEALSKMDPKKKREIFKRCEEAGIISLQETAEQETAQENGPDHLWMILAIVALALAIYVGLYSYMRANGITFEQVLLELPNLFQ